MGIDDRRHSECLILFTRYPEPGTTKTRLIPQLGPRGAADIQRQMTEHILAQALPLMTSRPTGARGYRPTHGTGVS